MIYYRNLGITQIGRLRALIAGIKMGEIKLSGNNRLKIYGSLDCSSGKRMNMENRVVFSSKEEAFNRGFRPCGHCQKKDYAIWKSSLK